ncbi:flagellar basal body-associated protein FliL [Maridesulfovibrio ferrireducens]|uniref:Flagellar protein FliL n=1 Tax=Maridesulfovibrio ferrireducens TaxID=246191 RepID=A0A1G9C4B3_9BACT|nr:flagellar basal body-associated protein FliL [Maridesulfovibrio ferrireducens]MBI9111193.1 flagellar basal body-associated FliL family protein [Maridesulfovibrio ferrireducens]SDK46529.1 flagellar FliL protein [Maridesulfovibrio ferrireducens]
MAEENGQEAKKKGSMLKWIILVLLLAVLGGGGFFAYQKFFAGAPEDAAEVSKTEEAVDPNAAPLPGDGFTVTLPTFVVNLADPLGRRYLKLGIDVEVISEEAVAELNKKEPMVKDTLILLLSSKTFQDLSSMENKILLKKEIVDRLNQIMGGAKVSQVYFTDMVIQ